MKSPDRFDLAYRCLYAGSIDWLTPVMLEMVAVGAIAMVLLLRMPLLSDKTAAIVESSLHAFSGIERVEACYDPAVMIITYDPARITDENSIVEHIRKQEINTSVEPLTTRDIPLIRKNYAIQTINTLNK